MKRLLVFLAVLVCGAALSSCTNEASVSLADGKRPVKLVFEASPLGAEEGDGVSTKTHVTPVNDYASYNFSWSVNDTVGIFPSGGSQIYFKVESDGSASSASFDGGAWMPKEGYTFRSYFPFIGNYYLNPAHIPVSFVGEKQTGNGNSDHFQKYDYMYTPATEYDHDKNTFTFAFKHLITGVLPYVELPAGHYTGLDLSLDTPLFVTEGEYDLTASSPAIVGAKFTKDFHVDLDITLSQSETLVAYVPLAPLDMKGKNLTITITDENDKQYTYTYVPGKAYAASSIYRLRSSISFAVGSVSVDPTELDLAIDETHQLTATVLPANAADKSVTWTSSAPTIASVDNEGNVTGMAEGTATITATATQGGATASCAVTVKAVEVTSVSLDNTELSLTKGSNASLTATVKPDNASDKTVSWSSDDTSVATVDDNGKVTAVGGGSATITATAGSKSATCAVTVTVPVTGVSLDKTTTTLTIGGTETLTATVAPTDATNKGVTWTSSATSVATVDNNGKITAISVGTATITVKTADGSKTAACAVTVNPIEVTGISLDKDNLSFSSLNATQQLNATITPSNATDQTVTWQSSDNNVATVSDAGLVTAKGSGSATITATAGNKSATCAVTVTIPVSGLTLSPNSLSLVKGTSSTLTAEVSPAYATDKTVSWTSSNSSVATVNNGTVTAVAVGTATITATAGSISKTCSVTVTPILVSSITISNASVNVGSTVTLTPTITPSNADDKSVSWTSSNTGIATVNDNGVVTGVAAGSVTITATAKDAGKKSGSCTVTVNNVAVTSVTLNNTTLSLTKGGTATLTATVKPDNATNKTVTWSSSDSNIATVDNTGKVTAKAGGSATITATAGDKSATCAVTVTVPVSGVSLNKTSATLTVGGTETLTATIAPTDATNKNVTWSSSNTNVATVSNGKITAKAAGSTTITVTTEDGSKTATCAVTVTVPVTGVSLNKSSLTLAPNATETLTATITPSNATNKNVTWSSNKTSVATVSSSGVVTAKSSGTATITVTTEDGSKTATCAVTVTVPVTGVSLNKTSTTLNVGGTVTLTATVSPSNATDKTVTWSSDNDAVASVNSNGVVTGVSEGNATITATTSSGGKTASCEVTVNSVPVTGVTVSPTTVTLTSIGEEKNLTATITPTNATDKSVTWTSSNESVASVDQNGKVTAVKSGSATITAKSNSDNTKKATCAVKVTIPPSGVSLNKSSLNISVGSWRQLIATVEPAEATNKKVTWNSSNSSVVTVDSQGNIIGKATGAATITVTTVDGNKTASCSVTVNSVNSSPTPEAVDLGLSVQWASFNIGAFAPEESGDYYAWGETEPYYQTGHSHDISCTDWREGKSAGYDWASYGLCNGSRYTLTKYVPQNAGSFGTVDGKTVLEASDDVANVKWGGSWRMPTKAEWQELIDYCNWEWVEDYNSSGVHGFLVTSKKNYRTIFLPFTGGWYSDGFSCEYIINNTVRYEWHYWSSSLLWNNGGGSPLDSYMVTVLSNNGPSIGGTYRYYGHTVRAVKP